MGTVVSRVTVRYFVHPTYILNVFFKFKNKVVQMSQLNTTHQIKGLCGQQTLETAIFTPGRILVQEESRYRCGQRTSKSTGQKGVSNSVKCSKQHVDMQQPLKRQLERETDRQAGREEEKVEMKACLIKLKRPLQTSLSDKPNFVAVIHPGNICLCTVLQLHTVSHSFSYNMAAVY